MDERLTAARLPGRAYRIGEDVLEWLRIWRDNNPYTLWEGAVQPFTLCFGFPPGSAKVPPNKWLSYTWREYMKRYNHSRGGGQDAEVALVPTRRCGGPSRPQLLDVHPNGGLQLPPVVGGPQGAPSSSGPLGTGAATTAAAAAAAAAAPQARAVRDTLLMRPTTMARAAGVAPAAGLLHGHGMGFPAVFPAAGGNATGGIGGSVSGSAGGAVDDVATPQWYQQPNFAPRPRPQRMMYLNL